MADADTGCCLRQIDKQIGDRIRTRRKQLRMSQTGLGAALGLTFQQIQKYEAGSNRLSACRLPAMARALGVPLTYFFEEVMDDARTAPDGTSELLEIWARLPQTSVRDRLLDVMRVLVI